MLGRARSSSRSRSKARARPSRPGDYSAKPPLQQTRAEILPPPSFRSDPRTVGGHGLSIAVARQNRGGRRPRPGLVAFEPTLSVAGSGIIAPVPSVTIIALTRNSLPIPTQARHSVSKLLPLPPNFSCNDQVALLGSGKNPKSDSDCKVGVYNPPARVQQQVQT